MSRGVVISIASHPNFNSAERRTRTRRLVSAVALLVLLATMLGRASAEHTRPRRATASGISTERLSEKNLRRWQSIERLVNTVDCNDQPLYPTLRSLWEWAAESSHVIYIEIVSSGRIIGCTAGSFDIEHFDPEGKKHQAVIRLFPDVIDRAMVSSVTPNSTGLIPFAGLGREERYLEVLGHELAHAVHVLGDLERARTVSELVHQTNRQLLLYSKRGAIKSLSSDMQQRLLWRDLFLQRLEEQAEGMEMLVWHELRLAASYPRQ
ncbi:MAG TPA: hypothetical protein VFD58_34455 [Blastocatellia bacterium]|nr:hypothetical protein [Blastocatellia bacterium]